jgi:hypothetical protein
MRERIVEFIRKEVGTAAPAVVRAMTHGAKESLKKFPEEWAKERKKRKKR